MTEFEKAVLEEFRALRAEVKLDINAVHLKIDKVDDKVGKLDTNLSLFKGKALGFMAVISALFNIGLHFIGKK